MAVNLGELTAMTKDFGTGIVTDNIYNKMFAWMMMHEREETYPGGDAIREQVEYSDDPNELTGGAISGRGEFEHVEIETADAAQFEQSYYVQTNLLYDEDVSKNSGSEQQFYDFVEYRTLRAAKIMRERFARHMFQESAGGVQLNGFGDIFNQSTDFGRISRADHDWWRAKVSSSSNARSYTLQGLADLIDDCSDGDDMPQVGITSTAMWNKIMAVTDDNKRHTNTEMAKLGFDNIMIHNIPIIKDKHTDVDSSTRHKVYFPNFNYLRLRPHSDFNMLDHPWMRLQNQLGQFQLKVWIGQMTCNHMRRQGLYQDLNPTA